MSGFGGSASQVIVANYDAVAVPLTGNGGTNTTETILKTVTIPALGINSQIEIESLYSWTSSANNKTFKIRLGGIGGAVITQFIETTNLSRQHKTIIRNSGSTSSQKFFNYTTNVGYGTVNNAINTSAIDTSASVTLVFTGQLSGAASTALDSIIYEGSTVRVII